MTSNRKESFRYQFDKPIDCTFQMIEIDHTKVQSKPGQAKLIDLSPKGMRIWSNLHFPIDGKELIIKIKFRLNEDSLIHKSKLIWKKQDYVGGFYYGMELLDELNVQKNNISELKRFTRRLAGMPDYEGMYYPRGEDNFTF
jgi:hypothetical protein